MPKKEIAVIIPLDKKPGKDIIRSLIWYDRFFKKMRTYECSYLKYIFIIEKYIVINNEKILLEDAKKDDIDFDEKDVCSFRRMVPEPAFTKGLDVSGLCPDKIEEWFEAYKNYNLTNAELIGKTVDSFLYSVPEKELEDFSYDLERHGIKFNVK